jgi:hypothetical protein
VRCGNDETVDTAGIIRENESNVLLSQGPEMVQTSSQSTVHSSFRPYSAKKQLFRMCLVSAVPECLNIAHNHTCAIISTIARAIVFVSKLDLSSSGSGYLFEIQIIL